jgi:2,4-dienoyl-CoA reductase-like NADH-dependent reductase (Old Yellow Enzyme family)
MWRPPNSRKHTVEETRWPDAVEAQESALFSPVSMGATRLKQRTWVPAMVPWRATHEGYVTDALLDWYGRFASGRPGAIVIEATGVRDIPSGPLLRIGDDRFIPGLKRLVQRVQEASQGETRLLIQLIDFLRVRRRPAADVFFKRFFAVTHQHRTRLVSVTQDKSWLDADPDLIKSFLRASVDEIQDRVLHKRELEALRFGQREHVSDTDLDHIRTLPQRLPDLFASAATRAQVAGFDGIELHYAHAYTMASFLSRTNTRLDGYGGDLKGRLRCPMEVFEAVRKAVGESYPVGCRYLVDEVIDGGNDVTDAQKIGLAFAQAGMDFLSLSKGGKFDDARQPKVGEAVYPYTGQSGYECMPTIYSDDQGPFYRNIDMMASVRRFIRDKGHQTPIVVAGGINDFDGAEAILQNGQGDIIAAARQSLADPDWFLKMSTGQGHLIRRCKFTNYCEALDTRHKEVTCQLWDRIQIHEPGVILSADGKRRLCAPKWDPEDH